MGTPIEPGPALALDGQRPILFSVLGARFHLEPITRADEPRFAAVNEMAKAWVGAELRWTSASTTSSVQRFEESDPELIELYPRQLDNPLAGSAPTDLGARLEAAGANGFYVAFGGAEKPTHASAYGYRFASTIPEPKDSGAVFQTASALSVFVPDTWPLADFYQRVNRIAAALRIRWGSAGLTYSMWEFSGRNAPRQAIYSHARRHVGYDVGIGVALLPEWHDQIRSINWLTYLGKAFTERLEKSGSRLADTPLVRVSQMGDTTLIMAGDRPIAGDMNRRQIPAPYAIADAMVRPLRAGKGLQFMLPWDEATTEQWLRRFELQVD